MIRTRVPLLLLPGSLCDARLFGPQLRQLGPRTVRVGNIGGASSIADIATEVLRSAPPRFALLGFSMGGIVALEIWRRATSRVAGMALLDTNFREESTVSCARRRAEIAEVGRSGTAGLRRLLREEYLPQFLAASNRDDPVLQETLVQMAAACGPAVMARQWTALMQRADSRDTLATVDCPALVLCGAEDRLCPPALHSEMAAALGTDCHVLDDCAHFPTLEAPQRTAQLLMAWLANVDAHEQRFLERVPDVAC